MKKTILITMTLLLGLSLVGKAQLANGTYAFLKATNSARVAALGGLPLPINDSDIQVSTYNPSAIDSSMNNKLGLSYVDYYSDINFVSTQYSRTFEHVGSFAATVQYYNYGHFDETTEGGLTVGEFSGSEYAVTLGWGRRLSPRWSIGAAFKYAGLQLESYSAGAIAVDVAGNFRAANDWVFSLTARNIGIQLFNNFDQRQCPLPLAIDFGASHKLEHLPLTVFLWYDDIQKWNKLFYDPLDLEGNYDPLTNEIKEDSKLVHFVKNTASHIVVGGELTLGKNIVLRAAYNYGQRHAMNVPEARTLVGFSAGVAVKIKMFEISYARSRSNIQASPNYLTISMDLNKF